MNLCLLPKCHRWLNWSALIRVTIASVRKTKNANDYFCFEHLIYLKIVRIGAESLKLFRAIVSIIILVHWHFFIPFYTPTHYPEPFHHKKAQNHTLQELFCYLNEKLTLLSFLAEVVWALWITKCYSACLSHYNVQDFTGTWPNKNHWSYHK